MSKAICPYCWIKETSKEKMNFYTNEPDFKGRCECGAWIDEGQRVVKVNGYADIYKGAVELMGDFVDTLREVLEYHDVKLDSVVTIGEYSSTIIERLFLPHHGSTTIANFKRALGITRDKVEWPLNPEEEWR